MKRRSAGTASSDYQLIANNQQREHQQALSRAQIPHSLMLHKLMPHRLMQQMWFSSLVAVLLLIGCNSGTDLNSASLELRIPKRELVQGETLTLEAVVSGVSAGEVVWEAVPASSLRFDEPVSTASGSQVMVTALTPNTVIVRASLLKQVGSAGSSVRVPLLSEQESVLIKPSATFEGPDAPPQEQPIPSVRVTADLSLSELADRYFNHPDAPTRGVDGPSEAVLASFEASLRQGDTIAAGLCAFNTSTASVLAGACGTGLDDDLNFSNPSNGDVFTAGRPVLAADLDPDAFQALHVLVYMDDVQPLTGYGLHLADSSQNDGFGGSSGDSDNAEVLLYQAEDVALDGDARLSAFSQANTVADLETDELGTFNPLGDNLRGAVLHVVISRQDAGSKLVWRCLAGDARLCDGQFRVSELTPDELFELGADAANTTLWLALNRVVAPESSQTSAREGTGVSHAVVWLEPLPRPDLIVEDVSFAPQANTASCTITFTVANVGSGPAQANVAFNASPVQLADGSSADNTAWSSAFYGLAAGARFRQTWTGVQILADTLAVTVDPNNTVQETSEANSMSVSVPAECQNVSSNPRDLRISKRLEGSLQTGQLARYVIGLEYLAGDTLAQVPDIVDNLPNELRFVRSLSASWLCTTANDELRCEYVADGPVRDIDDLVLELAVAEDISAATVTNCARVVVSDANPANNEACVTSNLVSAQASSDLRLTQGLRGSLREGRLSQLVIQVRNDGPDDLADNIQVVSTLPTGINFLADNSTAWRCRLGSSQVEAEQIVCDYDGPQPISVGAVADVVLTVNTTAAALSGTGSGASQVTVCSRLELATPDSDPDLGNNRICNTFEVSPNPDRSSDMTISKSLSGSLARGELARYVLQVSNLGDDAYVGSLSVLDNLPEGVQFVQHEAASPDLWRCQAPSSSQVRCDYLGDDVIAVGALPDLILQVRVSDSAPDELRNCAELLLDSLGAASDPEPSNNQACLSRRLSDPEPEGVDVSVQQALVGDLQVGAVAAFDVQVANLGSANVAVPVVLRDSLPAGLRFVAAETESGWTCTVTENTSELECNLAAPLGGWPVGSLPALSLIVEVLADALPELTHCVSVTATGDTNADNNTNCLTREVRPADPEPYDLALELSLRDPLTLGGQARYSVQVANLGPGPAPDPVTIQVTLPSGLRLLAVDSESMWQCESAVLLTELVVCELVASSEAPLAVGSLPELTLTVSVTPDVPQQLGEDIETCATLLVAADSQTANNSACVTGVLQASESDLVLSSAALSQARPGEQIELSLQVRNDGPNGLSGGLSVTTPLPVGFRFVSSSTPAWTCDASRDNVRCQLADVLNVGAAPELRLTLAIDTATSGVITTCSSVTALSTSSSDPDLSNNDACLELVVAADNDLSLNKVLTGAELLTRGSPASYTITVRNEDDSAVSNVPNVLDRLPEGLLLDNVSAADWICNFLTGELICDFQPEQLAAGSETSLIINVEVATDAADSIENCAALSLRDANPTNSESCALAEVVNARDLAVDLDLETPLTAGAASSYVITVTHETAEGANLSPIGLELNLATGLTSDASTVNSPWTCDLVDASTLSCQLTPTDLNAIPLLTVPVNVPADATGSLTTCVELAPDAEPSNNEACLESQLAPLLTWTASKTLSGSLQVGRQADYVVSASLDLDKDDADAINEAVRIRDDLPSGTSFVGSSGSNWTCEVSSNNGTDRVVCTYNQTVSELATGLAGDIEISLEPLILTVSVQETAASELENCAFVSVVGVSERVCVRAPVTRVFDARLAKFLAASEVEVGNSYSYRIEVTNSGPNFMPLPITVTDTLPLGVRFRETPAGLGWTCNSTLTAGNRDAVTCTYNQGDFASLGALTNLLLIVDITTDVPVGVGTITNCATLLADGDSDASNNEGCVENRVVR